MGNIFTTSLIENNKNLILFFKVDEYPWELWGICGDEDERKIFPETGNEDGDGEYFRW
jgi:hypothetical protein